MRPTRRLFSAFVLAFVTYVMGPGTSPIHAQESKPLYSASVRLKWLYDPGFAGELVAKRAGFFEREALRVEIKPGGFDADPIRLVAAGADTIGVAGADTFLLARAKGLPIVAFAAGYLETAVVYYALEKSGIRTPRDFLGKRVGYQAGQDTATIYEALMTKLDIPRNKVREIPVRFDFSPLLTGEVDVWPGYIATQSYIMRQRNIPYNVIKPQDYGINVLGTVYFTTEKVIREQPDLIRRFVKAVISGWEFTFADYAKSVPMIASYDEKTLTPDLIIFNLDVQRELFRPEGMRFCEFTEGQWTALQEMLLQQKLLSAPVDLSKAANFQFVREAYQR